MPDWDRQSAMDFMRLKSPISDVATTLQKRTRYAVAGYRRIVLRMLE